MAEFDDTPKEHPHWKQKEGRLVVKALKESHKKALSKESEVVKMAKQAYYKAKQPSFEQEGSYDLSSTFEQMASSTNLLGTEIHEVQESWDSQKNLQATNWVAKSSPRDICFLRVVSPTESLKIMGLKGIHSPKALKWWGGLNFCPWCGKEGQN